MGRGNSIALSVEAACWYCSFRLWFGGELSMMAYASDAQPVEVKQIATRAKRQ